MTTCPDTEGRLKSPIPEIVFRDDKDLLQEAKNRQLWQFQNSEKLCQFIMVYIDQIQELYTATIESQQLRTLALAANAQLDIIGRLIGQERFGTTAVLGLFGFEDDATAEGFSEIIDGEFVGGGRFIELGEPASGPRYLEDPEYRRFILAKIYKNHLRGATACELSEIAVLILDSVTKCQLIDGAKSGNVIYYFYAPAGMSEDDKLIVSTENNTVQYEKQRIITAGAGINIDVIIAGESEYIFSFDDDPDPATAGFDELAWSLIDTETERMVNGTFDTDISGWNTYNNIDAAVIASQLWATGYDLGLDPYLSQTKNTKIGQVYTFEFEYVDQDIPKIGIGTTIGGIDLLDLAPTAIGTHVVTFKAITSITYIRIGPNSPTGVTVLDNLSLKESVNTVPNGEFSRLLPWVIVGTESAVSVTNGQLIVDGTQLSMLYVVQINTIIPYAEYEIELDIEEITTGYVSVWCGASPGSESRSLNYSVAGKYVFKLIGSPTGSAIQLVFPADGVVKLNSFSIINITPLDEGGTFAEVI